MRSLRRATSDLTKALRQSHADLVHAHFGTGGVIIQDACRHLQIPLVVTFHGYDLTVDASRRNAARLGRGYGKARRALIRDADAIIAVSQFLAGRLVQVGAESSKVHVIPCGVDTARFEPTRVPDNRHVLFVGRLVEKKGCDDLIRAVAGMKHSASLTIVGDGPLRPQLEARAAELHVSARFLGQQPPERVRYEMRHAQVVAIPSKTATDGDQEGLSVVALEAAASRRPVVGYEHGGLPDAVVNDSTGTLVTEGDVPELSAALEAYLNDYSWCERAADAARRRVVELFDLRRTTAKIERVYDRLSGHEQRGASAPRGRHTERRSQDNAVNVEQGLP